MKFYEVGMIITLVIIGLGVAIGIGNYFYDSYWPDDNPAEEHIEEQIKEKTGVDLDLTPKSPE